MLKVKQMEKFFDGEEVYFSECLDDFSEKCEVMRDYIALVKSVIRFTMKNEKAVNPTSDYLYKAQIALDVLYDVDTDVWVLDEQEEDEDDE